MTSKVALIVLLLSGGSARPLRAQPAAGRSTTEVVQSDSATRATRVAPAFNVDSATQAYMMLLPPARRARSDAYFEGGYWLLLWNFLLVSGILILLLQTGISARMRNIAVRATRFRWIQAALYFAMFATLLTVLQLPLSIYQDYVREHQYGLSNLTFPAWMGEQVKSWLLTVVGGGVMAAVLYAAIRRTGRRWWIWGSAIAVVFMLIGSAIVPVVIVPIFNHPTRLTDQRVVQPILSMARANGIDTHDVWEIDASKQTTRISANVSGLFGTERITLNDNLLNRASLPEIEAVTGHEMGHYVLNHVYKLTLEFGVVLLIGFALVAVFFERLRTRYAERWAIGGVDDLAGMPLLGLLFIVYFFLMTPVMNTITRTAEYEADIFGLNAARQPDGFARAALDLSDYRKMDPDPLEEIIFYDHPSGHGRIYASMRWKAENTPKL